MGFLPAKSFTAASADAGSVVESITGTFGAFDAISFAADSNFPLSPDAFVSAIASTLSFCPTLSISDVRTSSIFFVISPSERVSLISTARAHGLTNFLSCLKRTVSSPIFTALSPEPRVIDRIGGAEASPSIFLPLQIHQGTDPAMPVFAQVSSQRQGMWDVRIFCSLSLAVI